MMAPIPDVDTFIDSVVTVWIDETRSITGVLLGITPYVYQLGCNGEDGTTTLWAVDRKRVSALAITLSTP